MSYIQKSSQHSLAGPYLSDVRESIRRDPDLEPHLRDDLLSALNTVAVVLERDLADIPAAPQLLRARLLEAMPGKFGKRPARWNNVRSLVLRAVTSIVATYPGRQTKKLDPAWYAKALALKMRFQCVRLSSLIHFCSDQGIPPDAVDQSTFDAFKDALGRSLRKNPAATYAVMVQAWNYAVRTVPGWPAFVATRPSQAKTWTFPWSEFPQLCVNKHSWLHRLGDEDLVNGLPFEPLRPSTIKALDNMLRKSASALALLGWDRATFCEVRHFGTLDAFRAVLRHMIKQRGGIAGGHIVHVAWMLKSIARHVTHAPQEELDEMAAVIRRLQGKQQAGMTTTNSNRLRPFDDPAAVKLFLDLPELLANEAGKARSADKAAGLIEMALAIELLQMAPLRISNLVALDLEQHIIRLSAGRRVWIRIPPEQVKNRMMLDYPLPDETIALLDRYLHNHRDRLVTTPTNALFPGRKMGFRQTNGFGAKIKRTIKKYTGLTVNPHLFRHAGGKLYLDGNPGGYEVVRRVLGHHSLSVTTNFYTGMETAAAIRHYQASILKLRRRGGQS